MVKKRKIEKDWAPDGSGYIFDSEGGELEANKARLLNAGADMELAGGSSAAELTFTLSGKADKVRSALSDMSFGAE